MLNTNSAQLTVIGWICFDFKNKNLPIPPFIWAVFFRNFLTKTPLILNAVLKENTEFVK